MPLSSLSGICPCPQALAVRAANSTPARRASSSSSPAVLRPRKQRGQPRQQQYPTRQPPAHKSPPALESRSTPARRPFRAVPPKNCAGSHTPRNAATATPSHHRQFHRRRRIRRHGIRHPHCAEHAAYGISFAGITTQRSNHSSIVNQCTMCSIGESRGARMGRKLRIEIARPQRNLSSHQSSSSPHAKPSATHTSSAIAPHTSFTRLPSSSASLRIVPACNSSAQIISNKGISNVSATCHQCLSASRVHASPAASSTSVSTNCNTIHTRAPASRANNPVHLLRSWLHLQRCGVGCRLHLGLIHRARLRRDSWQTCPG